MFERQVVVFGEGEGRCLSDERDTNRVSVVCGRVWYVCRWYAGGEREDTANNECQQGDKSDLVYRLLLCYGMIDDICLDNSLFKKEARCKRAPKGTS